MAQLDRDLGLCPQVPRARKGLGRGRVRARDGRPARARPRAGPRRGPRHQPHKGRPHRGECRRTARRAPGHSGQPRLPAHRQGRRPELHARLPAAAIPARGPRHRERRGQGALHVHRHDGWRSVLQRGPRRGLLPGDEEVGCSVLGAPRLPRTRPRLRHLQPVPRVPASGGVPVDPAGRALLGQPPERPAGRRDDAGGQGDRGGHVVPSG
mmetsp:Transcript_16503/g.52845  ORF Transcript_16503/g.52845 Transcript_16503/m.52845 type:complete len:210 (+) Transcript_16503:475-1104(+)